jgi:Domain of unknown function (DUF4419)
VTFAVDRVVPATKPLTECRKHESLRKLLASIESCHDYHGNVVREIYYQPLLAAVYMAFSQHRPLILTPDAVWITIAQGVAHHMAVHGERLRSRFVAHQGKLELVFECEGWTDGSPENPWPLAFESWADQIREHVGAQLHDALICDFSTTGPTERAASQIVMMDIFERYFHYVLLGICGIPTVTLEGTPEDWQRLAEKVAHLRIFDMDWWLDHLEPICQQFVRASQGDVDLEHWQNICKLRSEYGGDIINGWVAKLFPYLRAFTNGPCNRVNPIFETGEGFQTLQAPSGLSRVPFTWRDRRGERPMEAIGGLIGVTQHPDTLALRPTVGWAVRQANPLDVCLSRLSKDHVTFPGAKSPNEEIRSALPADLSAFYHHSNGAEIILGDDGSLRIVPCEQIDPVDWGEDPKAFAGTTPHGRVWHRFGTFKDGLWLAINLDYNKHNAPWIKQPALKEQRQQIGYDRFAPICCGSPGSENKPGANPVVALSFGELLQRLLDSKGRPYWLAPDFVSYGDADLFTRRDRMI